MTKVIFLVILTTPLFAQPILEMLPTSSRSSLRGLSAVSDDVCWTSGSMGTVLLTIDGGRSWSDRSPASFDSLQFRDIHAVDRDTAFVLSAGLPAVILKTTNGGKNWETVYRNTSAGVFFNAFDFWDLKTGIAFSDAPADKLLVIITSDWGKSWDTIPAEQLPAVHFQQGGFAASGTSLKTFGESSVIIALGGKSATTLLSHDRGLSWTKTHLPLDSGSDTKGIFSCDFLNLDTGICVGGDYRGDTATNISAAIIYDGDKYWQPVLSEGIAGKYRSCVTMISSDTIVAVSRTGISYSTNGGSKWDVMEGGFYSVSYGRGTIWLSGNEGSVAKMQWVAR